MKLEMPKIFHSKSLYSYENSICPTNDKLKHNLVEGEREVLDLFHQDLYK